MHRHNSDHPWSVSCICDSQTLAIVSIFNARVLMGLSSAKTSKITPEN